MKISERVAAIVAVVVLALSVGLAGATAAEAYTYTKYPSVWMHDGNGTVRWYCRAHVDYSWWEETFLGKRDYWTYWPCRYPS